MSRLVPFLLILAVSAAAGFYAQHEVKSRQQSEILDQAYARLQLFLDLRKTALEDHFKSSASDVRAMSRTPIIRRAMLSLGSAWVAEGSGASSRIRKLYVDENPHPAGGRDKLDAADASAYSRAHGQLQPWARQFLQHFGYTDLYLLSLEGDILYSAKKNAEFTGNATTDGLEGSALGYVFSAAKRFRGRRAAVSDFEAYQPRDNSPVAFAASAIPDGNGQIVGVLAVQMRPSTVEAILDFNQGLGESGETYVVGADGLMRSQSRFETERTLLKKEVRSESITRALGGFSGTHIITNYRGERTLSAYAPLELQGERWALIAERGEAEVAGAFDPRWSIAAGLLAALVSALVLFAFATALLFRPASAREEKRRAMKRARPAAR